MNIELLISQIQSLDGTLKQQANKAVNRLLTIRNWLIGYYIVEYEQNGEDKGRYGSGLLQVLSSSLGIKGLSVTNLKINRDFYIKYPQIRQTLSDEFEKIYINCPSSSYINSNDFQIRQTASDESENSIHDVISANENEIQLAGKIVNKLSFSHITLLLDIENPLKRTFYAIEAIKGTWSVRELKRQISSLLFERSGLSKNPQQLLQRLDETTTKSLQHSFIKDIYTFEFLGLPLKDAVEETDLEHALLDHLQQFLLEMGHGFCLEARQKRILIGDEYFFIDLVFYHRILKCHVLVDLKIEDFNHNNAGQLNTYINYYKKEIQLPGDNAPVGILMVTNKNEALVEYATAGMDEKLFVRKYMLELPDKKDIEALITKELKNL